MTSKNKQSKKVIKSKAGGLTVRFIGWFLAIALIPLLVVSYFSYVISYDAIEEESFQSLETASEISERLLVSYFQNQFNILGEVSESVSIIVARDLNGQSSYSINDCSSSCFDDLKLELGRVSDKKVDFYEVFLVDANGIVIASNNEEEIGENKRNDLYFINGKKGPYIKDIYDSKTSQRIGHAVSVPVYKNNSSELLAVLAARSEITEVSELLMKATNDIGETGDVFLINSESFIVSSPRRLSSEAILSKK